MHTLYTLTDIIAFVTKQTGCCEKEVTETADIVYDLGCCGDDLTDLLMAFKTTFDVDLYTYRWYFHTEDEGSIGLSIGRSFFKPPYERVTHIAITPLDLLNSANTGKWSIIYPTHHLPEKRYDLLIDRIVLIGIMAYILYRCLK